MKLIERGSMNPQCTSQPRWGSVWANVFLRYLAVLMDVLCTHPGALGGFMYEGESARCRDWVVGDCDWVNGSLGDLSVGGVRFLVHIPNSEWGVDDRYRLWLWQGPDRLDGVRLGDECRPARCAPYPKNQMSRP